MTEKIGNGDGKMSGFIYASILLTVLALALMCGCMKTGADSFKRRSGENTGKSEYIMGQDISPEDITDFYYTLDSWYPEPVYQRYRFYIEDGKYMFFYDRREGESPEDVPLQEDDSIENGTIELSNREWESFMGLIDGGAARKRDTNPETGDGGPWLYIYWNGDGGEYQEFSFRDSTAQSAFVAFCEELKSSR